MINQISLHLKDAGFIVCRKESKHPEVAKGQDWNNYIISYDEANKKISEGYNIAIVGGYNNFVVVDCDTPELYQVFTEFMYKTYSERSISGGQHLIYRFETTPTQTDNFDFNRGKEHLGEFRAFRRYVVISPSKAKDEKKGIKIVKNYEIIEDNPIISINNADLDKIRSKIGTLSQNMPKNDESRSGVEFGEVCQLIKKGLGKDKIFKRMNAFSKWNTSSEQYREHTYISALKSVQEDREEQVHKEPETNVVKPLLLMSLNEVSKAKVDKNFIIEGMLYPDSVNMLFSPPAQFKSLLNLHLALCVSRGEPFMRLNTRKTSILLLDKENNLKILQDRLNGLKEGHYIKTFPRNVHILKQGDLLDSSFVRQLFKVVKENKIKLVIFDTLHRFADYDENKADDLNRIYNSVFEPLRHDYKCSVLFLHHTKKNGGYRGSSDFLGMVDTAYSVYRTGKTGRFTLNCEKARSGEMEKICGNILFGDNSIIINRLSEDAEEVQNLSKQKELTSKIKQFAPENMKFKKKDVAFILEEAGIDFTEATLKRALTFLRSDKFGSPFFEFDERTNEYWRVT